jgi:tetratricopeptide (TPR) repeat protein
MAKKRVTRKQLLKEPDEFITLSGRILQWSRQHTKQLVTSGIVLFVLIAAVSAFSYYDKSQEKTAAALLGEGLAKMRQQVSGENRMQALSAAEPEIQRLVDEYGGQPAGRLGRIVLGHIHLSQKESQEALVQYHKALEDYRDDPSLTNVIYNGLSAASELKGEDQAAIGYSEKIVAGNSSVLKDVALYRLARLYQKTGETEKSAKAFEQLYTDFPESTYAAIAKERASS